MNVLEAIAAARIRLTASVEIDPTKLISIREFVVYQTIEIEDDRGELAPQLLMHGHRGFINFTLDELLDVILDEDYLQEIALLNDVVDVCEINNFIIDRIAEIEAKIAEGSK